jgi:hypothetical protein
MTKPLSPAARAVLNAANGWAGEQNIAAAALRAAANQVAPAWDQPSWDYELVMGTWQESERIRRELLAIAAEIDGINPTSEEN